MTHPLTVIANEREATQLMVPDKLHRPHRIFLKNTSWVASLSLAMTILYKRQTPDLRKPITIHHQHAIFLARMDAFAMGMIARRPHRHEKRQEMFF